jgi:hypothetical protein
LEFKGDVFHDVGSPSALCYTLQEATTHAGAAMVLYQAGQKTH